jgi:hypothetical protein
MRWILTALVFFLMLACNNQQKTDADTKTASASADSSSAKPQQAEFADAKYADMGKALLAQFENGNIDEWSKVFAGNAVWTWSAGDSLAGKEKIVEYWKKRRSNLIDSLKFTNDIWLPIKVNIPQKGPDLPGVWLLSWYQASVKYKQGKKLTFWVHTDFHFDSTNKIDRVIEYIDRAPLNKAQAAMQITE